MGFFKKIGTAIKKNVSFKNLVKIATPIMGAIPFVGGMAQNITQGLSEAHEAKKQAKAQGDAQKAYDAQVLQQQTMAYAGSQVGAVANAGANMFAKGVLQGVNDGLSAGVVEGGGQIGATMVTSTLKAWFTKNWKIVVGAVAGLIALIWFLRSRGQGNSRVAKRR